MNKMNTRDLARIGIVAAIYFVLAMASLPLVFGPVQFRISEALILLCFYNKKYGYSMVVGCALVNMLSPLGIYDVIFGTVATALTVLIVGKCTNLIVASLFPTLLCVIIGLEYYFLQGAPFLFTTATILLGEFAVLTVVGVPVFKLLERNKSFMKLIDANQNVKL